jgi:hypothetical protein
MRYCGNFAKLDLKVPKVMMCENNHKDNMLKHLLDSRPLEEYEGLSFKEIHYLIYDPYSENSPMSVTEGIDANTLVKIPFFNLVKYFLDLVEQTQPIKINANGYLPLKIIKPIYDQHFISEDFEEIHEIKIVRHGRSLAVKNVRIITDLAGLTETLNRDFYLTQKGKKYKSIANGSNLFAEIIKTYTTKYNWSFNDNLGKNNIGQFGFAYILKLISKYGNLPRKLKFYMDKYFNAFNSILINAEENKFHEDLFQKCIVLRTFIRFLNWFGLISMKNDINNAHREYVIEKSDIFDTIFKFE